MSSQLSTPTLQACRTCGGGAPVDVHFCPQCTKILSLGRHGDYFAFLGVPRKLSLDEKDLEQRFRALSRQFHPDYFHNAPPAERLASLERSSYLNDAYRTLRDPIQRAEYLIQLALPRVAERPDGGKGAGDVPPAPLEEVFALNEELDEIRELRRSGAPIDEWKARLDRARGPIEAKRLAHDTELRELSSRWDRMVDAHAPDSESRDVLEALRQLVLERNYVTNLLTGIERELTQ
ncbi:MAG: Fe-S protein assembly co-chaperone HscB [Vicinamibacterales bacterium]